MIVILYIEIAILLVLMVALFDEDYNWKYILVICVLLYFVFRLTSEYLISNYLSILGVYYKQDLAEKILVMLKRVPFLLILYPVNILIYFVLKYIIKILSYPIAKLIILSKTKKTKNILNNKQKIIENWELKEKLLRQIIDNNYKKYEVYEPTILREGKKTTSKSGRYRKYY